MCERKLMIASGGCAWSGVCVGSGVWAGSGVGCVQGVVCVQGVSLRAWMLCASSSSTQIAPLYYPDTLVNPDTCLGLFIYVFETSLLECDTVRTKYLTIGIFCK